MLEDVVANHCDISVGKAKNIIEEGPDGFKLGDTMNRSPRGSTMYGRMGRKR